MLFGWLIDSPILERVFPSLPAMNPMTALSFVVAGFALWCVQSAKPVRLTQAFSIIVIAIAALRLGELLFSWNIGVDQFLFPAALRAATLPSGMAPNTALAFLLTGGALFLSTRKAKLRSLAAQAFALIAMLIAFLSVIGYAYQVTVLYFTYFALPNAAMSLHTSVTFLILCVGILSAQPDVGVMALWRSQTLGGVLARRLTMASLIVLLIVGWLQVVGERVGFFDTTLGEALFALVSSLLLIGAIWWTAHVLDRTDQERRTSRTALSESEALYRALFEYSSDGIIIVGKDGRFLDANLIAERLTGYTHDELLQRQYGDLTANLAHEGEKGLLSQAVTLGSLNGEHVFVNREGGEVTVEFTTVTVAPGLYQEIFHDISERKQVEENLRASLEQERELNELKSRFVSMVSHDFRTPLTIIQSSSDLLLNYLDRMNEEKRQDHLEKIQFQITRLIQMLDNILIIGKAQMVGLEVRKEHQNLTEFCAGLVEEFRLIAPNNEIIFKSSGTCEDVMIDPRLMRQAITNLLSNAIKYSPAHQSVVVDLACSDAEIVLSVQDHGIGIPEADQKHLFEFFHRAENVGDISGTGLGLTIVKQAIDAHGGSIQVSSLINTGTTFIIHLPRTQLA